MKNLVKIAAVLSLFSSLSLIGMGATSTGAVSATSAATNAATNSVNAVAANAGVSAHGRNIQHHQGGYSHSRDRNSGQNRFNKTNTPRNSLQNGITPVNRSF